jgi:hypothetical protein
MARRWPTFRSSAGTRRGISLFSVVPLQITPEPDDAERGAILAALAAEEAERSAASEWTEALLPQRGGEANEP